MFKLAYSGKFEPSRTHQYERICKEFVQAIQVAFPDMLQKPNLHLLHLVDCMKKFGPASAFNTERLVIIIGLCTYMHIKFATGVSLICLYCGCKTSMQTGKPQLLIHTSSFLLLLPGLGFVAPASVSHHKG